MRRVQAALMLATSTFTLAALADDAATLFERGRALMKAGDCAQAVELFGSSQKLDPSVGTAINAAICQTRLGNRLAAAEYFDFVTRHAPAEDVRKDFAEKQLHELDRHLAKLIVSTSDTALTESATLLNGKPLPASFGSSIRLNPGRHALVLRPSTPTERTIEIVLQEGETRSLAIELASASDARGSERGDDRADTVQGRSATSRDLPAAPGKSASSKQRTIGYVALGVSGAAAVTSLALGALVLQKRNVIDDNCEGDACNRKALDAQDSGQKLAAMSTVAAAVGVSALAVGAYLVLSDGSGSSGRSRPVAAGMTLRLNLD